MQFIGYVIGYTNRAVLFQDHYWHKPDWMPRSQIQLYFDPDSIEATVYATPWICKQKEISESQERTEEEINERNRFSA